MLNRTPSKEAVVSRLPPFLQVILAGVFASLLTSLIFLALDLSGAFATLGVPMGAPPDFLPWLGIRLLYGGFFALLLLLPFFGTWILWQKGLLIGLIPAAELFFYRYPFDKGIGFFGLDVGISVPIVALFFSLLWGAMTGWLLTRFGFPDPATDDND